MPVLNNGSEPVLTVIQIPKNIKRDSLMIWNPLPTGHRRSKISNMGYS